MFKLMSSNIITTEDKFKYKLNNFMEMAKVRYIMRTMIISFEDAEYINREASETKFEKFDLHFGTQSSKEVTVVSGGFGVRLGLLNFHYGIQIGSQHLGLPQMLDISIKLP